MWLVSLGRKRCKDKERASWCSFCESCEERDVESRSGRQPCCGGQQFLRASGKGTGGSGSFRHGVCSSRWVLRRVSLEDCNFLPGNSWSKKRLKIFNSHWVGYKRMDIFRLGILPYIWGFMTGLLVFKVTQQNQQGESLVQLSGCPMYALVLTLGLGSGRLLPLAWMQQHVNTYICQRHSFKTSSPGWSRERGLQATIIRIPDTQKKVDARHKSYCFKVVQADCRASAVT